MRAYVYERSGDAYSLTMRESATKRPGAGEVCVRVRATSLNYRDLVALRNKAGRDVEGRVPLSDGAGEVVAIGEGVMNVRPAIESPAASSRRGKAARSRCPPTRTTWAGRSTGCWPKR